MQLPLPINQIDEDTFENFHTGNSEVLVESLKRNFTDVQQPFFFIWGAKSCGKSHLLKAVSNHFLQNQQTAAYIPLTKANYFSPLVLDNAELLNVICLDDIQAIAGDTEWELAIFNLFNRIREQQGLFNQERKTLLLISANCPPYQLNIKLPDLYSRLTWGEVYQLSDLTDEEKCRILQKNAYRKGMELSNEVAAFLLKNQGADLGNLAKALEKLDHASLQAQRKLTIPFVKEALLK